MTLTTSLNRWLPSITLACWSGILLYFHRTGRLAAFLHPTFRPGVLVAGVVLLVFALGSALGGGAAECCDDDGCAHPVTKFTFGKVVTFAVLFLPLLLAFSTFHDGFGVVAITNRGIVMDASGTAGKSTSAHNTRQQLRQPAVIAPPYVEPALPTKGPDIAASVGTPTAAPATANTGTPDQYIPKTASGNIAASVIDLLYAAQDPSLRVDFEGKTVEVIGQLMGPKVPNPHGARMKVVRMFMTCCAADAKPIAALVELPEAAQTTDIPELSWVRIIGKPAFPMEGGRTIAILRADSIGVTEPPEETMLY